MIIFHKKILLLLTSIITLPVRNSPKGLMVLTYHRIADKPNLTDPLVVSVEVFEEQVKFLTNNYNIISAGGLVEVLKKGGTYPNNACLITFDDGWRDNYTHAFPILKRYDVPALFFLSTDYISSDRRFWHEDLRIILDNIPNSTNMDVPRLLQGQYSASIVGFIKNIISASGTRRELMINDFITHLKNVAPEKVHDLNRCLNAATKNVEVKDPSMLSWEQVDEMFKSKMSFGSHTQSHSILTQIDMMEARKELQESKRVIESRLKTPIYFFSYPNGYYNAEHVNLVKEAGYLGAFSCMWGTNLSGERQFELKRNHVREDQSYGFRRKFSETFFAIDLSGVRHSLKRSQSSKGY